MPVTVKMVRKFKGLHRAELKQLSRVIDQVNRREARFPEELRLFTSEELTTLTALGGLIEGHINDTVPKT